jgi:hypothetical protein
VNTLLEAAHHLQGGRHRPGAIVLLDQVNPLPFMLGRLPPRGGNLWSGSGAPAQPPEKLFADADYVLIPRFSTYSAWTEQAELDYGPYLAQAFPIHEETRSWVILGRRGTRSPAKEPLQNAEGAPLVPLEPAKLQ